MSTINQIIYELLASSNIDSTPSKPNGTNFTKNTPNLNSNKKYLNGGHIKQISQKSEFNSGTSQSMKG